MELEHLGSCSGKHAWCPHKLTIQLKPLHIFPNYSFKILFNIIPTCIPQPPKCSPFLKFYTEILVRNFNPFVPRLYYLSWFDHSHDTRRRVFANHAAPQWPAFPFILLLHVFFSGSYKLCRIVPVFLITPSPLNVLKACTLKEFQMICIDRPGAKFVSMKHY